MKRKLSLFILLAGIMLIYSTSVYSQRNNQQIRSRSETTQQRSANRSQTDNAPFQRPDFMTEDGQIDLSKLPDQFSAEMRENWIKADKDGDGFLNEEERQTVFGNRVGFPGRPMGNFQRPDFMTEDGQIDLSKLPEQFSAEMRENWVKADKDGDGFLNEEERQTVFGNRGGFPGGPMGGGPMGMGNNGLMKIVRESMNDEKQVDISKFNELLAQQLTELDANNDNSLSQEEIQAIVGFGRRPGRENEPGNRNFDQAPSDQTNRPMGPGNFQRPDFMTEDDLIDLSKLPEQFPAEMREIWANADQDGDGFLNQEEQQAQMEQMRQQRPDFANQQNNRSRNRNNRSENQLNSERRPPNDRNGNSSRRMPPEMTDRMNEMVLVRLVSTTIQEKSADKKTVEASELKDAIEESLKKADADENQLLDEDELQKLNETLPSMRPDMPPGGFDPMNRPENDQQPGKNRPSEPKSSLIQGDVPNDSFAFIPKSPKFKFSFDLNNKKKGEEIAITEDYCLAKYPVTNADYKKFVDATNREETPKYWKDGNFPEGKANHPVLWVSIQDAQDYCQWLESENADWQFRLPTEAEWENAAAGPKKSKYPWGNNEKSSYEAKNKKLKTLYNYNAVTAANYLSRQDELTAHYSSSGEEINLDSILSINPRGVVSGWKNNDKSGFMFTDLFNELVSSGGFTTPVDQYKDSASFYGCFDMAGNSFDWTSSQIEAQNGAEKGQTVHAIRGGSWYSVGKSCQTNYRGEGRKPQNGYATVGFRVVAVKK